MSDAPKPGTAVVNWKEQMAAVTAKAKAMEAPKGGFLSFKGGNISFDENQIPGNKLDVIVLDFLLENGMFRDKYNPNKAASPMCYAIGRDEDELKPHEECEEPQAESCSVCPHNEWGSDPDGGRGKACKNSRRIAIMAASDAIPEKIKKAPVLLCKLPVTSLKNFATYVNQVTGVLESPPFGVITELSTKPHPTSLFQVHWKVLDKVKGDEVLQGLYEKHLTVDKLLTQPYPKMEEEAPAPAPKSKKF